LSTAYITHLLDRLPHVGSTRMVQSGIGVWVVWSGQLDAAFDAMLAEYGGFRMAEAPEQALWYFFDDEAFRVLARHFCSGGRSTLHWPRFRGGSFTGSCWSGQIRHAPCMFVELSRQHCDPLGWACGNPGPPNSGHNYPSPRGPHLHPGQIVRGLTGFERPGSDPQPG